MNEILKNNTYNHFWKQTSSSQRKLLSIFDIEQEKMQMAFLETQIPYPKTPTDYKSTIFELSIKDIHSIDQMDMHKQTGEMISSTLTNIDMSLSKLQVSYVNSQSQLKMEKVSSLAKDNRIKSLEDLVVKIGYDPKDINVAQEVIKKKNLDIPALRKQLNLPSTKDPLNKDIEENVTQKADMMKLIIYQNVQIKQMEIEMEIMIKEKEQSQRVAIVPLDAIPITQVPAIGTNTVATSSTQATSVEQVTKTLENMSIQSKEINKLHGQLKALQEKKSRT